MRKTVPPALTIPKTLFSSVLRILRFFRLYLLKVGQIIFGHRTRPDGNG